MRFIEIVETINLSNDIIYLKPRSDSHWLIAEYLQTKFDWESEVSTIQHVASLIDGGYNDQLEDFIMTKLEGYTIIDNATYARIGGAHDLSPTLLISWSDKRPLIYHPNTKHLLEIKIDLLSLIEIIQTTQCIIKCIGYR